MATLNTKFAVTLRKKATAMNIGERTREPEASPASRLARLKPAYGRFRSRGEVAIAVTRFPCRSGGGHGLLTTTALSGLSRETASGEGRAWRGTDEMLSI